MEGHDEDQGQTDTWVSLGSLALKIVREAEGGMTKPVLAGGSFVAGKEEVRPHARPPVHGGARRDALGRATSRPAAENNHRGAPERHRSGHIDSTVGELDRPCAGLAQLACGLNASLDSSSAIGDFSQSTSPAGGRAFGAAGLLRMERTRIGISGSSPQIALHELAGSSPICSEGTLFPAQSSAGSDGMARNGDALRRRFAPGGQAGNRLRPLATGQQSVVRAMRL